MKILLILLIFFLSFLPVNQSSIKVDESVNKSLLGANNCPSAHSDNLAVLNAFLTNDEFANDRQNNGLGGADPTMIEVLKDPDDTSICSSLNQEHPNGLAAVDSYGYKLYKYSYYKVGNRYIVIRTGKKPPVDNLYNLSMNAVYIYELNFNYLNGYSFG